MQESSYKLRPETAESLFVLHQVTGNPVYREWGWAIFQAIEKCVSARMALTVLARGGARAAAASVPSLMLAAHRDLQALQNELWFWKLF